MARAAAKVEVTANDERLRLIEALKFAAAATEKQEATGLSQFVTIHNQTLMASNETFAIGVSVATGLDLCLHADKLLAALNQCGSNFQMVQISAQELSVKSGNFRAIVPVLPSDATQPVSSDLPCGALGKPFLDAIEICAKLCSGKGERAYDQSILFQNQTIVGTNGGMAIEYWHGFGFPGPLAIPKKTADTLAKLKRPLKAFGFSNNSVTFYFADDSFLKTRLCSLQWPDINAMFQGNTPQGTTGVKLWKSFADGLKAIEKFIENDVLHFTDGALSTHADLGHAAATYVVPGLPPGFKFSAAYWRIILPHVELLHLAPVGKPWAFTAPNLRGLIIGRH